MMRVTYFMLFLGMLSISRPLSGQNDNLFTFPELESDLITLWTSMGERQDSLGADISLDTLKSHWLPVREKIRTLNLKHLASEALVAEFDLLIYEIEIATDQGDRALVGQKARDFLEGFREVRHYFTSDLYPLDELWFAYDIYEEIYLTVNDPMLGLYDWGEFLLLFDDFQRQFEKYMVLAKPGFKGEQRVVFEILIQSVLDCSSEFAKALQSANQEDFVAPCDETGQALRELMSLYSTRAPNQ